MKNLKKFMHILDDSLLHEFDKHAFVDCPVAHFFAEENIPAYIAQNLPFHFYWKDQHGIYQGCNDTQAKSDGLQSGQEILTQTDFNACQLDTAEALQKNDREVMTTQKLKIVAEKSILKNGRFYSGWSYKWPLFSKNGLVMGVLGISFNVHFGSVDTSKKLVEPGPSQREQDCLYYLVKGFSAKGIARLLNISHRTVEHHLESAKFKMQCFSREDLISKAWNLPDIKNRFDADFISHWAS